LTARTDADAEPQALKAGFDSFVRKPVTGDMLVEAIAGVLGQPPFPPASVEDPRGRETEA
jgi:DNA-binding response OmpR family regulator